VRSSQNCFVHILPRMSEQKHVHSSCLQLDLAKHTGAQQLANTCRLSRSSLSLRILLQEQ
jgi:hypothetical protein